jgi:hypothetical protein
MITIFRYFSEMLAHGGFFTNQKYWGSTPSTGMIRVSMKGSFATRRNAWQSKLHWIRAIEAWGAPKKYVAFRLEIQNPEKVSIKKMPIG